MVDGNMEQLPPVGNRRRSKIELPSIPMPDGRADDVVGAPMLPPNEHLGASAEVSFRSRDRAKADAERAEFVKSGLRGPESLMAQPLVLVATRDALNTQLRDLRAERKNADGLFVRFSKAGRERLAMLDRAIIETRSQRDDIEKTIEKMLPAEARSVTRGERIRAAKNKIVDVVGLAMAGQHEGLANIPQRDVLRANRARLEGELSSLNFWQFGRKREIVSAMQAIDHEMADIINAERGR